MVNLTVINLKDILKFLIKIICLIIIICVIFNLVKSIKQVNCINKLPTQTEIMDGTIILSKSFNNSEEVSSKKESGIKKILVSELAIFNQEEELMEKENQEEVVEFDNIDLAKNLENTQENNQNPDEGYVSDITEDSVQEISSLLPTKVLEENNKLDKYTDVYNSVKIKNESKYALTQEMLTPNVDFKNKKDIIIYHTHTCESYTQTPQMQYIESGNFRTTDLNFNVARVGTELTNYLNAMSFNVNHNSTYHDYPAYTGSYTRSLATVNSILENNDAEFVIDLHRDALGSNSAYAPSVQIGDEVVAQVMFVMGTDGGGLEHPNWLNNLKLAVKIQEKANEMYPGFFKPIILRDSRYNQHVTTGACIIEVGATGNTLEQCLVSMKYLSKVILEVMK